MDILKPFRKPVLDPLHDWADAELYRANSYACIPVEREWASREPNGYSDPLTYESPQHGRHAWGLGEPVGADQFTISIQAGRLPRLGSWGIDQCRAKWLCLLKLPVLNKRQWRNVAPLLTGALIRTYARTGLGLAVFKAHATVHDPRDFSMLTREATGVGCFLPTAPWLNWHEGRSPLTVHRDELPSINGFGHARDLAREIAEAVDGERAG